MSSTSIDTRPVQRKLTGLLFAALLLPAVPASASSLVMRESGHAWSLTNAGANGGCDLPQVSIRTDNSQILSSIAGNETAVDTAIVEDRWASGATSHWNAGMNRAVDHLVNPPEHVGVYATQTGDDLRGHFEGTNSPNETVAAFEVVIH
jgi:hypothetical protein